MYTELQSAVHAMIQRLEYSFTFNPTLLTIPKRKQQVAEILEEAEKYRDDVEAQLGVKLLERREDFKTRISIISGCHTGPYALGIACIPKYTTIRL